MKDINEIWHPAKELPEYGKHICVYLRNGNFTSWFSSENMRTVFEMFNVEYWAYAEDITPKKEEE